VSKEFVRIFQRSIAVDSGGHPHIAYGSLHLHYAYHDGTHWQYEVADASSGVGDFSSIALDPMGKAHISYFDGSNTDLMYATNAGGSWDCQTVEGDGNVGLYTSICLDQSGNAHISFYDSTNGDLMYATNAGGSWQTQTVEGSGDVGLYTSIGIDPSGNIHISYYDKTNRDLKYALNASGSWQTYTVDSDEYAGAYSSMDLDQSGNVHIGYFDEEDLKYATNTPYPDISVYPASYHFGDTPQGGASGPVIFTISNIGNVNLHITRMTLSDSMNFTLDAAAGPYPCGGTALALIPFESRTLGITFTPQSGREHIASLTIASNDPHTPNLAIPLRGFAAGSAAITRHIDLPAGWSMVSLPVLPDDARVSIVFPGVVALYKYTTTYELLGPHEELVVGKGYWIFLSEAHDYTLYGAPIERFTLPQCPPGWSMIGGCSCPATPSVQYGRIRAIAGFANGYRIRRSGDSLEPGRGYWINLSEQTTLSME